MASTHICPKCGNRTFSTPVHVMQDWEVDEDGEFISCLNDCLQVSFSADDGNIWSCMKCDDGEGVIVPDQFLTDMDTLSSAFSMLQTKSFDEVVAELSLDDDMAEWIKSEIS